MKILVINPGSTSTKIATFDDNTPTFSTNIHHSNSELAAFGDVHEQYDFRKELVLNELSAHIIPLNFDAVIGRGGIAKPVPGGAYEINDLMIHDNLNAKYHHACNLGCKIASDIAKLIPGSRALMAEPGVVDEMAPVARISGRPEMPRSCVWHALNQRAVAKHFAREHGMRYEDLNLIVCHIGGGVSVAAHDHGKAVDVNNAISGEGPFSTERSGSLPSSDMVHLSFSGKYTKEQLLRMITGKGGITAHLGTNDMREVMKRVHAGDQQAKLVVEGMVYNIAKWICSLGAYFCGNVDAILVTGGVAHCAEIVSMLRQRVEFMAPFHCFPGESEMIALAEDALAVLHGEMNAQEYK